MMSSFELRSATGVALLVAFIDMVQVSSFQLVLL